VENALLENVTNNSLQFLSWFQGWAIKYNISHVALNELITGIKPYCLQLPKDARTLLGTLRRVNAKGVEPKNYYHFKKLHRKSFITAILHKFINYRSLY